MVQVGPRPVSLQQLRAGARQRLAPARHPEQLAQERKQGVVVVDADLPVVLGNGTKLAVALRLACPAEAHVGLDLPVQARPREVARADRDRLVAAVDLGMQARAAVCEIARLDPPRLQGLHAGDDLAAEQQRESPLQPVLLDLLGECGTRETVLVATREERLMAEQDAERALCGRTRRHRFDQLVERREAGDDERIRGGLQVCLDQCPHAAPAADILSAAVRRAASATRRTRRRTGPG